VETGMQKTTENEAAKRKLDQQLDRELEDTFPASDPPKVTRRRKIKPLPTKPADKDGR
jgi:hypothetical protein